jgi:hypothetical protein
MKPWSFFRRITAKFAIIPERRQGLAFETRLQFTKRALNPAVARDFPCYTKLALTVVLLISDSLAHPAVAATLTSSCCRISIRR